MTATFLVSIDTEAADPQSLLGTAEDIHSALDGEFDVIDVKPWARPSIGYTPTVQPQQPTGVPPVEVPL